MQTARRSSGHSKSKGRLPRESQTILRLDVPALWLISEFGTFCTWRFGLESPWGP